MYYYITNLQGDVATYDYDPYGNITWYDGELAYSNPIRYRGYYYDRETGFYYLQSRYYDPSVGRFINADSYASTGQGIIGNNMFTYCCNNPINSVDSKGEAAETIWDLFSLGVSLGEVVANPADPWAWAGLLGDIVDVALPCFGGLGEAVDATKTTVRVIKGGEDVVEAANIFRRTAEAASEVKKSVGAYIVIYESGQNYIGKGGFYRAVKSAIEHMSDTNKVTSIIWGPTSTEQGAFVAEYLLQSVFGVKSDINFNIIWSPGKSLFDLFKRG